jgi:hypothetical protein
MAGGEYLRLRYKDPGPTDLITQRVNALRISIPIKAPNRRYFTFPTWSHFPGGVREKAPRKCGASILLTEAGA